MSLEKFKKDKTRQKRKELLEIPIQTLCHTDNLGDPNCKTCRGHGCVDEGHSTGTIMSHCPDCHNPNPKLEELEKAIREATEWERNLTPEQRTKISYHAAKEEKITEILYKYRKLVS
jgi:hypothetical protein